MADPTPFLAAQYSNVVVGALVGGVLAALGYVAKLAIDTMGGWRTAARQRLSRLVLLRSYLLVIGRVFALQNQLRDRLCRELVEQQPDLHGLSYDDILAQGYAKASEAQKLVHGLIRQYTISAMCPLNKRVVEWLEADTWYKVGGARRKCAALDAALRTLEAHETLWLAKYEFWILNHPERALVYMVDEDRHGIGFPKGIEDLLLKTIEAGG
jgi:hypothetical protein